MTDKAKAKGPGYFGPLEISYNNGVQIDFPARLAVDFLKAPELIGVLFSDDAGNSAPTPLTIVRGALDLAEAFIAECGNRGYLKDLPDDDGLSRPARMHLRRMMRAQVVQQTSSQSIMRDESAGTPNFEIPPPRV